MTMLRPALRPPMRAPMRSATAPREGVGVLMSIGNRLSTMSSTHYVRKGSFTWLHKNKTGRAVRNVRARYPAWYINNGSLSDPEGGAGSDLYVWASIEVDGVAYQFTKDGSARLSIASLATGEFDPIPSLVVPAGATFKEHVYVEAQNQTSGFILYGERPAYYALGDGSDITSPANQTMSGGATEQPVGFRSGYQALNIFGTVSAAPPRMAIVYGDSNAIGYTEGGTSPPLEYTADTDGNIGAIERIFGASMPVVNISRGSLSTAHSNGASKFAKRFAALAGQQPTDLVMQLGRNDIGVAAATTLSRLETCISLFKTQFPSIQNVVLATLPPTTQGDWTNATPSAGQTLNAQSLAMQAERIIVNAAIRAKTVAGQTHCLDMAALVEVNGSNVLTQDGQYWKANSTLDGVHFASTAHIDIASTYPLGTLIP